MRHTDRLINVLKEARAVAKAMGNTHVGTQHVMIALLQSNGIGTIALRNLGVSVDADKLKQEVNEITYNPERDGLPYPDQL